MKNFSDWPVRNKLLVPSIFVILIGGLFITQTFLRLTSSVRDETLQHIIEIGDLRAAVLNLTGEYRESILTEEVSGNLEEVNNSKTKILNHIGNIQSHQVEHHIIVGVDFDELKSLVLALFKTGDRVLVIQNQIGIALEKLEDIERSANSLIRNMNKQIEEIIRDGRSLDDSVAQIPKLNLALDRLSQIEISSVSIVSETREYVLSGEDATLAELKLFKESLLLNISELVQLIDQPSFIIPLTDNLQKIEQVLLENSDNLIALAMSRVKNIQDTETVAEELQALFETFVNGEVESLDGLFNTQKAIFLSTIVAVLLLVIVALTVSANRIRQALERFEQAARKLKQGDLDVKVIVRGKDEFGQLADTFNDMAEDLRNNIAFREIAEAKLKTVNADLEQRVEERTAELKEARDTAEAANQLKSHLVTTMSHELRTPLTSIIGSLGMLSGKNKITDADSIANLLELANRNSQQLARLVDDILDVDKLDASVIEFELKKLELSALVRNAVDLNVGYANEKAVDLVTVELVPGLQIVGDEMRLMQVMANLISNATKFSPEGGTVGVSMAKGDGDVTVSVTDEGPGVPDDIRSTIFDRFVRGENTDSRNKGGAGLGLNISKTLVEKQGGKIGFTSNPGELTTFFFTLPLVD